jgi:hypothetical protein
MNIIGEASGATGFSDEKQKTFGEWLNEAETLYRECKSLISSCVGDYKKLDDSEDECEITEHDNDLTVVRKVNSILDLDRKFKDSMKIVQAKECIDNALKQGVTKKARDLESDIGTLFIKGTGAEFQHYKARVVAYKAVLVDSLESRREAVATSAASGSDRKIIRSKERLDKLAEKCPSVTEAYWDSLKEVINYGKRFVNDESKEAGHYREWTREWRQDAEDDMFSRLGVHLNEQMDAVNEAEHCVNDSHYFPGSDSAKGLSNEEIANTAKLFDYAIESIRNLIEYAELLSDPQTPQMDPDRPLRRAVAEQQEENLDLLISFQSTRAFWESVKLTKYIDSLRVSEDIKKNVLRIDKAIRELLCSIADCYPDSFNMERPPLPPGSERNRMLLFLAKSYEYLAGECHWLAQSFPKKHAQTLSKLGELLSSAGEGLFKELDRKGLQNVAPEAECKAFIDNLLGGEPLGPEERDFDEEARGEETLVDAGQAGSSQAEQEAALGPSVSGAKEERTIAARVREVDRIREEKARQLKAVNKDKRSLEKIEQKLGEKKDEIEQIKHSLSQGAHIRYLAWDLESAPKEAAKFAQRAHGTASRIADKLKALEEISISAGAISEERHRDEIAEYVEKAGEYEELRKQRESEVKVLRMAKTKAFLGIEGMRKSSAAKRLLIELIEQERGAESLNVTTCKTLPKYPQAKNRFGILETKDGQPLYDHVVEFRIGMEKVPEFLVHFHFRHPLASGKTPDYYMEKMEIHDWNVQGVQKQEAEEKVRSRQLEGGKKVLTALHDAWKKSLEMNRGKKQEIASGESTGSASAAPAPLAGKRGKGKAKRR